MSVFHFISPRRAVIPYSPWPSLYGTTWPLKNPRFLRTTYEIKGIRWRDGDPVTGTGPSWRTGERWRGGPGDDGATTWRVSTRQRPSTGRTRRRAPCRGGRRGPVVVRRRPGWATPTTSTTPHKTTTCVGSGTPSHPSFFPPSPERYNFHCLLLPLEGVDSFHLHLVNSVS